MSGQPTRLEWDLLGDNAVPADAYYGVQMSAEAGQLQLKGTARGTVQ